ncbi:MAG: hypothetical protein MJY99_00135 [Fibrobacter sp.]|uniref:hypothetical protein n=1 Tax=Fibrobacter sp. TaxID=35828 RepID=UPI00389095BA|nr:hypothetical protein [Fibrobacter sp.]
MKLNKDMFKMTSRISLLLCGAVAFASAQDSSLVNQQKSLLGTLDSLNSSVMGLRLGGTAKAGVVSSAMSSDQLVNGDDYRENEAFTDVNLVVTARPSEETEARVELRVHKDWQNAYEESVNPVIGHWFSYDGKIVNKHVDFNLGYMRIGYTPLTIYVPQTEILQEPEIFASKRIESLALRNLDTTSNRVMQGLNARYNSFEVGPFSNIYAQMTGARLRNIAKKNDEVFFDFDWSDRYLFGANAGVEAFGATLGGNFVYTFDREKSTRSRDDSHIGSVYYEDNMIYSGVASYDTKDLIMNGSIHAGLGAEFAGSKWTYTQDAYEQDTVGTLSVGGYGYPKFDENGFALDDAGATDYDTLFYVYRSTTGEYSWNKTELDELKGIALHVDPYVKGEIGSIAFDVKGTFVKNDEKFWSEQAASNYYVGGSSILNAEALITGANESVVERFRSGTLENMYFSIYNTNVLQQQNLMSKNEGSPILVEGLEESYYTFGRLNNNYKLGHFYKNGYEAVASKRMEYANQALFADPSVNLAMPMGLATPDRMGFAADADFAWNSAVSVNVRFSKYSQDAVDNDYTTLGAGAGVDVAPFLGLDRRLIVQGSYENSEESEGMKRKANRIVAGLTADVWGPFTVLGGVQMLTKEYGIGFGFENGAVVNKVEEMLAMGGLQIKLGAGAVFDFEGGLMSNTVKYTMPNAEGVAEAKELGIDKLLLMGNVKILF